MSIINFNDMKRSGQDEIARLNEAAAQFKSGGFQKDERYWQPELDKNDEGSAIIRFLPSPPGEDVPFVRLFSYGFKGPTGKWFIENCPSTLGNPSPVLEINSQLWDTGLEENKELARKQKRRLHFITNIYVVRHRARPSDEGKVFLYKFGKKIWEKLEDRMNPDDEDRKPMNPFDLWTGANFRLKVGKVSGFRNYDKSEFDEVGPLSNDDAELERIWRQCYSLQAEIAPEQFKSYDELKRKYEQVVGGASSASTRSGLDDHDRSSADETPPFDLGQSSSGDEDPDVAWLRELASKG